MAARLKTRLSAGAALVTGLGMMGVATALPAHAAATATYTCTVEGPDGPVEEDISVTFETNAPATVAPGNTVTVDSVTATATIPLAGASSPAEGAEVTVPVTAPVTVDGEPIGTVDAELTSEAITVDATEVQVQLADHQSRSIEVPLEAAGRIFQVLVPESFDATFSGFAEVPIIASCETEESAQVIDTVVVTSPEMEEEPEDAEDIAEVHEPADEQPPGGDASADEPAVPQVVQTDGLTPRMLPQEDDTLGYVLGGLLLAGAGAGTVLVARRRSTQH
ncbi:hypothetical protein O9K63_08965 [Janibacter cremeus]|uniref:hypothetical protein n=1 Tax=Janibacter cremeus TaxID=1285192 RepID=UPI0023F7F731|nr:hypothetical protein [Janibacter cremeus]WEV76737.1 hypothetical protein O9K63_08965 [Janibacter cremeus]